MNVTIIETKESEILSIIDPKTGMDWTNDLLGNHGDLAWTNEEYIVIDMYADLREYLVCRGFFKDTEKMEA